jgi:K+-sensing histidine kinase KdpD
VERSAWCKRPNAEAAVASTIALVVAFAIRYAVHPLLDDGIPTFTFLLATFYIAIRYGYRWALLELVMGFLVATYFFIKPYNSFMIPDLSDIYRMTYFFSVALVAIFVFEKINRDRYEAEMYAEQADQRFSELVRMDRRLG